MSKLYAKGLTVAHIIERVELCKKEFGIEWKDWKKASRIIDAFADNIKNIEKSPNVSEAEIYGILSHAIRYNGL